MVFLQTLVGFSVALYTLSSSPLVQAAASGRGAFRVGGVAHKLQRSEKLAAGKKKEKVAPGLHLIFLYCYKCALVA